MARELMRREAEDLTSHGSSILSPCVTGLLLAPEGAVRSLWDSARRPGTAGEQRCKRLEDRGGT